MRLSLLEIEDMMPHGGDFKDGMAIVPEEWLYAFAWNIECKVRVKVQNEWEKSCINLSWF
jgi:hypothetical protein